MFPKEHSRTRGYLGPPKSQIGLGSNPKAERPRDTSAPVERQLSWCPSVMASSPPPHSTPPQKAGSLGSPKSLTLVVAASAQAWQTESLGTRCSCSNPALLCGPSDGSQPRTYEGGVPPVLLMEAETLCRPLKRVGKGDV